MATTKKNTSSTQNNLIDGRVCVSFAALDRYVETNIVSAAEKEIRGSEFMGWGDSNQYPQYLFGLMKDVTLFRTLIQGIADYVVGDGVKSNTGFIPDDDAEQFVRKLALDYLLYGGFAIDVERSKTGELAKLYYLDFANIRSDKKNEFFWYSTEWQKSAGRAKATKYAKYRSDSKEFSSIFYYKNSNYQTYPMPPIMGDAAVAVETIKSISDYHFNNIQNGFSSPTVINFNNGQPTDEQKKEIEDNITEKFTGPQNAGRTVLSFNDDKEHAVNIAKIPTDDFDKKYETLLKNSRQVLFAAYKATPALFGIPTENNGFSTEEYDEQFKLFNRTVVRPIQKIICNACDKITKQANSVIIQPFSINWDENNEEKVS